MSDLTITRPPAKEWLRDRLPEPARDKLDALIQTKADTYALLRETMDKVADLRATLAEAEQQVRVMREQHERGDLARHVYDDGRHGSVGEKFRIEPDDERLAAAEQKVANARAALERQSSLNDARAARWQALGSLIAAVERYVDRLPENAPLDIAPPMATALRKGETPAAAVERARRTREKLVAEKDAVRRAPISSGRAKEKARAQIRQLAESAAPNVIGLIEGRGDFEFPKARELLQLRGMVRTDAGLIDVHSGGPTYHHNAVALMAWLFGDDLIARIDEEIDAVADDAAALDEGTRAQRVAALDAEILLAEREEEAATLAAHDSGIEIERRPDLDPRAFLSLSDAAPAPRE
jgi:hypothetical protein